MARRTVFERLHQRLIGYMASAGLVLFADEPNLLGGDAGGESGSAAGDASAGAAPGGQPTGEAKPADGQAGADGKPAGEAKPAEGEKKPEDKPASKAPETYEFKPIDGFELDAELVGEFTPILKDLDLTQEQADKLVAFAPRLVEKTIDVAVAKTLEDIGYAGAKDWPATVKADKEIGGDKLPENIALAKRARDQFATPELRKLLETTPLGNNPEIVRLFVRIGKAISEDGYVPGGKTRDSDKTTAQKLFPNMNP